MSRFRPFRTAARATRNSQPGVRRQFKRFAFETLELRMMLSADTSLAEIPLPAVGLSEIHGVKWSDFDGDSVRDESDTGLAGVTIYLDANNNGILDDGELSTVTATDDLSTSENETGAYEFTGLMAGTYIVREVVPTGYEQTYPIPPDGFDLEIVFPDNSLTASQRAFFTSAAERWEEIIRGGVPDVMVPGIGLVDDIVIEATAPLIDGPSGILGAAGPDTFRAGSFLPSSGVMFFDSADLPSLIASGQFDEVILHEMGHVLGIGTIWEELGLLQGVGTTNPQFLGPIAAAEYSAIFGINATSVPVEGDQGGSGTLYSHWDEATFENELMTGFLDSNVSNPLSRITVGQMADLGYVVDLDAADNYTEPALAASLMDPTAPLVEGRILAINNPRVIVEPPSSLAVVALITTPSLGFWTVELADGEIAQDVDFGNMPLPGSISGTKWNDRNGDGVRDEGEEGLAGWTIYIDENGDGVRDAGEEVQTIESSDVPVTLPDLTTNTSEIEVTGFTGDLTDINVTLDLTHTWDGDLILTLISPAGTRVELAAGVGGSGNNFTRTTFDDEASTPINSGSAPFTGSFIPQELLSTLDGEDPNGTWLLEVADVAELDFGVLNSWSITIAGDPGEPSTITDANGNYRFDDLPAGEYIIAEVGRGGWFQSFPTAPGVHSVTLAPGQELAGLDFGNHQALIRGTVWNDYDADGLDSSQEPSLAGWTVFFDSNGNGVLNSGPSTVASAGAPVAIPDAGTLTSQLTLGNLGVIEDLNVTVNLQHTYDRDLDVFLISPSGARVELFSDVGGNGDNFTGTTLDDEAATSITAATATAPFTGSFRPEGLLSAFDGENAQGVWKLEVTDDSAVDIGQLISWSITVTTSEKSTVTNADGSFVFGDLLAGEYKVAVVVPAGWELTHPQPAGRHDVTLAVGQTSVEVAFGARTGAIGGQVWNDANSNGSIDPFEDRAGQWLVYLDNNANNAYDAGVVTVSATGPALNIPDLGTLNSTINVSGLFAIDDINVTVNIQHTDLADLDVFLISPVGTRVELFTDLAGGGQSLTGTVLDDEVSLSIVAGSGPFAGTYKPEGSLADLDGQDSNGVWTLEISDDAGNDIGKLLSWSLAIDSHERMTETDSEGQFIFHDLLPGSYAVRTVLKPNWAQTAPTAPGTRDIVLGVAEQSYAAEFGVKPTILFGDYNRDGVVSGNDFLTWQRSLGATNLPPNAGADGDGDTDVDVDDLFFWEGQFTELAVPAIAAAVVALDDEASAGALDSAFATIEAVALAGPTAYSLSARVPASAARPRYRPTAPASVVAQRVTLPVVTAPALGGVDADGASDELGDEPATDEPLVCELA
jgi:subtilisin-like proprotein convertase family protein